MEKAFSAFTVTVTPASLCRLTTQFVQGGGAYARLGARQKQAVDVLGAAACANLAQITSKLRPAQKAVLVALYEAAVTALVPPGWLTSTQATTLKKLADALQIPSHGASRLSPHARSPPDSGGFLAA